MPLRVFKRIMKIVEKTHVPFYRFYRGNDSRSYLRDITRKVIIA